MDEKLICQCCGMPLTEDVVSKNIDGSINNKYCKWCYVDGKYTYKDMNTLIDACVKHMVNESFTEEQAREYLKEILPKLEHWKK